MIASDVTNLFVDSLNNELDKFERIREEFTEEFSKEDFDYLVEGWKSKLVRCNDGHQRWGMFECEK